MDIFCFTTPSNISLFRGPGIGRPKQFQSQGQYRARVEGQANFYGWPSCDLCFSICPLCFHLSIISPLTLIPLSLNGLMDEQAAMEPNDENQRTTKKEQMNDSWNC